MRSRRPEGGSRLGTFFFLMGCLAVLALTFAGGVLTGRHSMRSAASTTVASRPVGSRESAAPGPSAPDTASKPNPAAAAAQPRITFYQELTAPLAPPTVATPPKSSARSVGPTPAEAAKADRPASPAAASPPPPVQKPASPPHPSGEPRYTVQVGAYRDRSPAEALRASLVAAGHDAYIVETDAAGSARYRVRVGSFATRQAAIDAATRLGSERQVATYVTTR